MPFQIGSKTNGSKPVAVAMVVNSTRCGHCNAPMPDGKACYVLDEPYLCLVHEQCIGLFAWNGLSRTFESAGRKKATKKINDDQEEFAKFLRRKDFIRQVPARVRQSIFDFFVSAVVLRELYSPGTAQQESFQIVKSQTGLTLNEKVTEAEDVLNEALVAADPPINK